MTSKAFSNQNNGTPIYLLLENNFDSWLEEQPPRTKAWVSANDFAGKGTLTLPDSNGKLETVLHIISDTTSFFVAGDLPQSLPKGNYVLDTSRLGEDAPELAQRFAISWGLASYRFDRYKTDDRELPCLCIDDRQNRKYIEDVVSAISLTRDLINTPASDMMPEDMAQTMEQLAEQHGATLKQIIGDELLEQNYPMVHAVGRASCHAPRFLDLAWGDPDAPKVTLVGKGVCFDSGGLNLKPGNFMRQMKKDMGGAAHVLGLAHLIMAQNLPVRLRVLVPAVENAVSANAFRPGDVLNSRKGLTVEIDNTDAEGRLVLCDALAEADTESPDLLIDFATLTGACRVALGTELPGFFCNDDELAHTLFSAANTVNDPVWQLPLHAPYQDLLKSEVADTVNCSSGGFGGAITAALYLQLFIDRKTPWIHFDVMAWNNRKLPGRPLGGEAFGVRAVFQLLQSRFEAKS